MLITTKSIYLEPETETAKVIKQFQARDTVILGVLADCIAAIFPMADFLIVTTKKTIAASRKNPARALSGDILFPSLKLETLTARLQDEVRY